MFGGVFGAGLACFDACFVLMLVLVLAAGLGLGNRGGSYPIGYS